MDSKEEPSLRSTRETPSSPEETTGSWSRTGRTAPAWYEKPALSRSVETRTGNGGRRVQQRTRSPKTLRNQTFNLCLTAVCGPTCMVVWVADGATRPPTRLAGAHV